MSLKKYASAAIAIGLGILFLFIPGLEPFGALSIIGGLGLAGVQGLGKHGK